MTAFELMVKLGTLDADLPVYLEIQEHVCGEGEDYDQLAQAVLEMVTVERRGEDEVVYLFGQGRVDPRRVQP